MKLNEIGIYFHMDQISPEAFKAQRQAELAAMAEYRQRHLQQVIEWSDPVKRAERLLQYAKDEAEGRSKLKDIPAELIAVRTKETPFTLGLTYKKPFKLSWWRKVINWLMSVI